MDKQPARISIRREWIILACIVACGASVRWFLRDWPNFAPVSAIALFSGYFFTHRRMAILAPLGVMLGSDLLIGGYSTDWRSGLVMASVYLMLAAPVMCRGLLRRALPIAGQGASGWASAAGLTVCCLVSSLGFFFVTNLAVWTAGWYEMTWSGLMQCYVQALPFFRHTLTGDFAFACLLFGTYAAATAPRRVRSAATA